MKIRIDQITIPADRQREDLGDMERIANSIRENGLIEPIVLDQNKVLIAGFRRLTAHIMLGLQEIEFVDREVIDHIKAKELELEENVCRHNLSWQEESKAIAELHALKMARDPSWSVEKTAETVLVSKRKALYALELSAAMEKNPEIAKAETQQGAMMRLAQVKQIQGRKDAVQVRQMAEQLGMTKKTKIEVVGPSPALDILKLMESNSFDMAISNPPFGVNIEDLFIGDKTVYDDSPEEIVPMLYEVAKEVYRVLRDDRWFVWFYPTARLEEGKDILRAAGFAFEAVPCVWYKPNKHLSSLGQPYQQFNKQYESFFFARKGGARFHEFRAGNVFVYDTPPSSDRLHPLQMPVALWEDILKIGSVEGETVLEPFSGSGSGGVASHNLGRNWVGLELSPEYVERSRMWHAEVQSGVAPTPVQSLHGFETLKSMETGA